MTVERIHGGLAGAVIGDSLGAITETLSIRQIREHYGWLTDYTTPVIKPFGQDRTLGAYTDDASLLIAVCRAALDPGGLSVANVVARLLEWSRDPAVAQYSGPSTKRALSRIAAGEDPRIVGMGSVESFTGASNGGAMKAAPAGWLNPGDVEGAARAAALICLPTHNTQLAIAGAAAVAAACARAMVDRSSPLDVAEAARAGARLGEQLGLAQGREVAGPSVAGRVAEAIEIASGPGSLRAKVEELAQRVGSGLNTYESVPAAIGVFLAAGGDVNETAIAAANIGDDTDTVGCMAAAIAGTYSGIAKVKPEWLELVTRVNGLDLEGLAARLAGLGRAE